MCMDKITGKQNQLIKDTKKLLVSAKARRDARSFVLEGRGFVLMSFIRFYTVALVLVTAVYGTLSGGMRPVV